MKETRTSRYLPIRDKIAELDAVIESIHQTNHKVKQLIILEKLLALKKSTANT